MLTNSPGHATIIAKDLSSASYSTIIAVGGDGTALEVANGLVNTEIPLGIIPAGTGNDFARSLGIPLHDIRASLHLLISNPPRSVDVGKINDTYFLNVASIGFDAEIVRDFQKIKRWIPGKASYYASVFAKFLTYRYKNVTVKIDNRLSITSDILLIAVANGRYYGGGMKVNPAGSLCDGKLDVILISRLPKYKIPLLFYEFVNGNHLRYPYVSTYRCRHIRIESDKKLVVNADG